MDKLKEYKAKSDETTIFEHNEYLNIVSKQIKDIYNIDNNMYSSLQKCIKYHDIGKVIDSFQNNIESKNRKVRHEIYSASIKYLLDMEKLAIITHHKQRAELRKYIEKECYESELKEIESKLGLETEDVREFIKLINRNNNKTIKDIQAILLKGYLQYCDHLGSAKIKDIDKGFDPIQAIRFTKYNSIQNKVLEMKSKENVLLIAPTGVGKTASSLFWSNLMQNEHKSKRIYYLLPYTASINALYKDMDDKNISVSMLHSKAEYFLDKIDPENRKELYNLFKKSVKQMNVCTIYQIVKAIFSCKRFEMILAQLKDSIFIIDEIHCFDIEQLALLLETLEWLKETLNISICIMSASIPSIIQEVIQQKLNITKVIKADECDYKIRHKLVRKNKNLLDDIDKIKYDLNQKKQVLICVNSVNLSQQIYELLKEYNPKLIHGRFNTRDREKSENNIKTSMLLIGTQAIEVSLDISYDVMYTEIAPFDSLQQRFGRVNRRGEKGLSDIFIYNNTDNIYNKHIIEKTDNVIGEIIENDNGIVLEKNTQIYLDKVYDKFDYEKYNSMCNKVKSVIKSIKVATFNENASENMCGSDTIRVLPFSLFNEYEEFIRNKEYFKARSLFVNIHSRNLCYEKNINLNKDYNIYVANYVYNEKGLIFEKLIEKQF